MSSYQTFQKAHESYGQNDLAVLFVRADAPNLRIKGLLICQRLRVERELCKDSLLLATSDHQPEYQVQDSRVELQSMNSYLTIISMLNTNLG